MASFAEVRDATVASIKASTNSREQLADWYNRLAGVLARRAQKLQSVEAVDVGSFLEGKKAEFAAHRAAKDAERLANGEPEE